MERFTGFFLSVMGVKVFIAGPFCSFAGPGKPEPEDLIRSLCFDRGFACDELVELCQRSDTMCPSTTLGLSVSHISVPESGFVGRSFSFQSFARLDVECVSIISGLLQTADSFFGYRLAFSRFQLICDELCSVRSFCFGL